jgi:tRNA A37 threonylcarbamoyladenosine dehydratase
LAYTSGDRLLRYVRSLLRKQYGFPRGDGAFGIECVYSAEEVVYPEGQANACSRALGTDPDLRLDCDTGFGTACFVTGTFGFAAAARAVEAITRRANPKLTTAQESCATGMASFPKPR